ncbi:hypothetical protein IQ06DRAFT_31079 [Phaeosphaeriaceae sp. SRC1lsM3a]|nr:hypothetical protein IQ06DRAFT_31079 [Stagonospora sp. SRC1lsM3a]
MLRKKCRVWETFSSPSWASSILAWAHMMRDSYVLVQALDETGDCQAWKQSRLILVPSKTETTEPTSYSCLFPILLHSLTLSSSWFT